MRSRAQRLKAQVGSLVIVVVVAFGVVKLSMPTVARPAGRVLATLTSALEADRAGDLVMTVADRRGIEPGLPVFRMDASGSTRPLAHVHTVEASGSGARLRLRFAHGESSAGVWRLHAYPPSRKLGAALEMAVTPEAARRFGRAVAARFDRLWRDALMPAAEERLPKFLARIDPTKDTEARPLVKAVTSSILQRLQPLLDNLANTVTHAMKQRFDLLDRLGLLLRFVRGDAKGLKKQLMPVAVAAAQRWWAVHQSTVLKEIGAAVSEHLLALRTWAGGELFTALREELVEPVFAEQRHRLEAEGEALLRLAADEFVESPDGGFRVRFAGVLRAQLLNKKTALLLLEPVEDER